MNIQNYGQIWTPESIVREMLSLRQNKGRVLEPSCGKGAFLSHLKQVVGIELDSSLIKELLLKRPSTNSCLQLGQKILKGDFFAYSLENQFETIIGNPPYVRFQDILPETKKLLNMEWFDHRSNLYLFFIAKSLLHLRPGGELIFITPRDFLKATSAKKLNDELYKQGTITYYRELGDSPVFKGYTPNCAIWRWQKGLLDRRLSNSENYFNCHQGQVWFSKLEKNPGQLKDVFDVKVGAVSGADSIFTNEKRGNADMVYSQTAQTGCTRRMIYNRKDKALLPYKKLLMKRRIRRFDESNWWEWGRKHCKRSGPRLYVNCKTRNLKPFFTHSSTFYDGSVLALFPKDPTMDIHLAIHKLNQLKWDDLGFACGGRLLFNQQSLSHAPVSSCGWGQ